MLSLVLPSAAACYWALNAELLEEQNVGGCMRAKRSYLGNEDAVKNAKRRIHSTVAHVTPSCEESLVAQEGCDEDQRSGSCRSTEWSGENKTVSLASGFFATTGASLPNSADDETANCGAPACRRPRGLAFSGADAPVELLRLYSNSQYTTQF